MLFGEFLQQVIKEQAITPYHLAEEMSTTVTVINRILSGETLLPQAATCKALLEYCKKNGIDTSALDWNEVLYEVFLRNGWEKEYAWMEDLDENYQVLLLHKTCHRKTLVPISAFSSTSMLCIHCWFERRYNAESYEFILSESENCHKVSHSCGTEYEVTYEQFKQNQYRCPHCIYNNRKKLTPYVGGRSDYSFLYKKEKKAEWHEEIWFRRFFFHYANCKKHVWLPDSVSSWYVDLVIKNAITNMTISDSDIADKKVFYLRFPYDEYIKFVKNRRRQVIIDFSDIEGKEAYAFFINILLNDNTEVNILFATKRLTLFEGQNISGYVLYHSSRDAGPESTEMEDGLKIRIIRNANFYSSLGEMTLENADSLLKHAKAQKTQFEMYLSMTALFGEDFSEQHELLKKQLSAIDLKITGYEALSKLAEVIEKAKGLNEEDDAYLFDEDDDILFDEDDDIFFDEDDDILLDENDDSTLLDDFDIDESIIPDDDSLFDNE